jgi:hypothetical protein
MIRPEWLKLDARCPRQSPYSGWSAHIPGRSASVRGIYTPLDVMFPYVPMFVEAVLIPFHDAIITDGLMQSPPMHISFGSGARPVFKEQYSAARAAGRVLTQLPSHVDPQPPLTALRSTKRRKSARRVARTRPA